MRILLPLATLVGLSLAGNAALAACSYPKANIKVPDGRSATLDEMKAAQSEVKAFNQAIVDYSACVETETNTTIDTAPEPLTEERKAELKVKMAQKINAAVKEVEDVAARFNEQLKAYKDKNKKT
jgi:predicted transglutaminase-like cysteine proteinase